MPLFRKSILRVGRYKSPDGQVDVTPSRLKHWAAQAGKMQRAGLLVPVGWDHADNYEDTIPVAFSSEKGHRSAKNTAGYLKSIEVASDGQSAVVTLDIPRAEDAAKVQANLAEISPIIYPNWRDGSGTQWKDVLTHIDLVNHPVEGRQEPFAAVEGDHRIACSIRMGLQPKSTAKTVKVKPIIFRMADKFGDDDDDDEPEDDAGADPNVTEGGDNTTTADDAPAPDAEPENPDLPTTNDGTADQQFEAIVAHLAEMAVVLPSDTDKDNFFDRLLTALMTAKANKDQAALEDAEDEPDEDDDQSAFGAQQADPQFAAMSLTIRENHREKMEAALQQLLDNGQCSPAEFNEHHERLGSVKMSLKPGDDGRIAVRPTDVDAFIRNRSGLPLGAVWTSEQQIQKLSLEEQNLPKHLSGGVPTEEEAEAIAARLVPIGR